MPQPCPSIIPSQLPHYTPSVTNQFGSKYDIDYIAPDFGATTFKRPATSGYLRNTTGFGSNQAIDFSRPNHGQGKGPGDPSQWPRGPTAQSRSSMGLHKLGDEPFGTTEQKSAFTPRPRTSATGNYPGANRGQGAADCIHGGNGWQTPERNRMPHHPMTARPGDASGRNAWKLHTSGQPLDADTTNSKYGQGTSQSPRKELPMHMWGNNPRERLYSNSVQKCPVPSLGIRTYPEDEHNPIRISNKDAERAGISRKLENEGWVKWNSVSKTSYGAPKNYPETDGLNRCRAVNKNAMMAARGGNSNKEMFGEVQARVVIDETLQHPDATTSRLAESMTARVASPNKHAHREGYSAYSHKFRHTAASSSGSAATAR